LGLDNQPDLGPLLAAAANAAPYAFDGQLWILESTVSPGVTEGELLEVLLKRSPSSVRDILLSFSPERVDPGSAELGLTSIPKIVAGRDEEALRAAAAFYREAGFVVVESTSIRAAETAKLLENTYRAVNLALINELVQLVSVAGIDFHEVVRLAETKPFGFQPFWPGPGVGGHCIPIDPWYLQSFLGLKGKPSAITNLALKINSEMPKKTARRIFQRGLEMGVLGKRGGDVTILGMAYKADVNDFRGAPGPEIVVELLDLGISVSYHDPFLQNPLAGVGGNWLTGDFSPQRIEVMTVVIQNHHVYRSSLSQLRGSQLLFSAAPGKDQIAKSIW
jgi:UDP-N-acetyl-D-glucosamine dehydrogenase